MRWRMVVALTSFMTMASSGAMAQQAGSERLVDSGELSELDAAARSIGATLATGAGQECPDLDPARARELAVALLRAEYELDRYHGWLRNAADAAWLAYEGAAQ